MPEGVGYSLGLFLAWILDDSLPLLSPSPMFAGVVRGDTVCPSWNEFAPLFGNGEMLFVAENGTTGPSGLNEAAELDLILSLGDCVPSGAPSTECLGFHSGPDKGISNSWCICQSTDPVLVELSGSWPPVAEDLLASDGAGASLYGLLYAFADRPGECVNGWLNTEEF